MAEIGSLEVSLSLDANNWNQSIAQVNRQMKAMGGELQALKGKGSDYERSVEGLSKKQDVLQRSLNASSLKLQEQRKRYDELVASGKASDAQLERAAIAVNKAQAEYNRLETELADVTRELKIQSSQWTQAGQKMQDVGGKLKSVGSNMTSIGKDLSMKVTAPIVALGAGAFKAAVDFESAFAGTRKTIEMTEAEFAKLEQGIRDMAKELPAAATDIAAVAESAGQLGIENDNILSFTRTIIDLGEATNLTAEQGATEFARFANIVGMSQENFDRLGSSIVALGNNYETTESEIMSMSMRLAAQGSQVGMSEAQILALATSMSSLGIQAEMGGTAMTTILKKIQSAVSAGGNDLGAFAKAAGMTGEEFKRAFETDAVTALDALVKGLAQSGEEGANLTAILADLGIKGVYESDVMLRLAGASDLLSDAVKTSTSAWQENSALSDEAAQRYETTASQMAMLKNQVVDVGISLGQTLIPMAQGAMEKIGGLVEKFSDLSPEAQKSIIAIGGLVAAAGPLLVIGGSIMSGVGGMVTTFGALSTAIGAAGGASAVFGTALGVLTGPVGWTALGIAAIGTAAVVTAKELSESSIQVEDWSDKVSESTAEAVGGFLELENQATVSLNQLAWSGAEITQEMADNMISIYDEMGNQVLTAMQEDHAAELQLMTDHFAQSIALTEQEEAEIITNMQTKQAEREQVIVDGQARIAEIMNTASSEKRAITQAEQQEINAIQQTMTDNAIEYLSESEREQKVILENLKNEASNITAQQAAEVVKNSVKQKDEVVKEANDQYNKTVAEIIKQRDEMGTISAEQAQKLIDEAKRQRDETVTNAEDMHQKVVSEAQAQADEHVSKVDWETGEVLSKWEVFKNDATKKWGEIKSNASKKWDEIKADTTKKWEEIKAWPGKKLEEMKAEVEKKMAEVKGKIETKWNEANKFLEDIDLLQIGKDIVSGLVKGIDNMFPDVRGKVEELAGLIPSWAKKILGIKSPSRVFMAIGGDVMQGWIIGLEQKENDLTQVMESISSNILSIGKEHSQKEIKLLGDTNKEKLAYAQKYINDKKSLDQLTLVEEARFWEQSIKQLEEGSDEKIKAQQNYKKAVEAVNKEVVKINEDYQKQMGDINKRLLDDINKANDEYNKEYSSLVDKFRNFAGMFDEFNINTEKSGQDLINNLQSQVTGLEEWRETLSSLWSHIDDQALMEELEAMGPKALGELQALNSLSDEELQKFADLYNEKFELARLQATEKLAGMKEDTENHILELQEVANRELLILQKDWNSKIKQLTGATDKELSKLYQTGKDAGQGLYNGLASMEPALLEKARQIANAIRQTIQSALQINSPSRVMHGFGVNIGEGLIQGMDEMIAKVASASARLAESVSSGYASTSTTTIDNSKHFRPNVNIYTQDSGERSMERTLRRLSFQF